jgi:hypothetical protein
VGYDWILNCSPIRYLALSRPPAERQTTCLLTERAVVNAAYGTESKLRLDSIAARKLGRMGGGRFVRRRKVLAVRAPIRVEHRQPTTARLHDLVGEPLRSISRKLGGLGRSADESERMSRLRHRSQHLGTQRPHVVRVREQIPACRMRLERKNRRPKPHPLSQLERGPAAFSGSRRPVIHVWPFHSWGHGMTVALAVQRAIKFV